MLTEQSVENIMKNRGVYPTIKAVTASADKEKFFSDEKKRQEWIDRKYKRAIREVSANIKRLVRVSNAYDFVFDNFIAGKPASEEKKHFQTCEDILNTKGIEIRKALNILIRD